MHIRNFFFGLLLFSALRGSAQLAPARLSTGGLFHRPSAPTQLQGPSRVDEFIVDGKLRLSLEDAILLTLLNNSDVNVNRAQFDLSQFAVERAHGPFDPVLVAGFAPTRSVSPSDSTLNGASTLSTLSQSTTTGYSQQFTTGTSLSVGLATTRFTTNSSFATVNPSLPQDSRFHSRSRCCAALVYSPTAHPSLLLSAASASRGRILKRS